MITSGYDVNNGSATSLPLVQLWSSKNIFTAQHDCASAAVSLLHLQCMYISNTGGFAQAGYNSLNVKAFFYLKKREVSGQGGCEGGDV